MSSPSNRWLTLSSSETVRFRRPIHDRSDPSVRALSAEPDEFEIRAGETKLAPPWILLDERFPLLQLDGDVQVWNSEYVPLLRWRIPAEANPDPAIWVDLSADFE